MMHHRDYTRVTAAWEYPPKPQPRRSGWFYVPHAIALLACIGLGVMAAERWLPAMAEMAVEGAE